MASDLLADADDKGLFISAKWKWTICKNWQRMNLSVRQSTALTQLVSAYHWFDFIDTNIQMIFLCDRLDKQTKYLKPKIFQINIL